MHIPKTYLSLHDITGLKVAASNTVEQHLVLTIDSSHGSTQIALFLEPLLTRYQIERLAEAVTAAMRVAEPAAVPPCPHEAAAYSAADDYYRRLKAELDRHPIEGTRR